MKYKIENFKKDEKFVDNSNIKYDMVIEEQLPEPF